MITVIRSSLLAGCLLTLGCLPNDGPDPSLTPAQTLEETNPQSESPTPSEPSSPTQDPNTPEPFTPTLGETPTIVPTATPDTPAPSTTTPENTPSDVHTPNPETPTTAPSTPIPPTPTPRPAFECESGVVAFRDTLGVETSLDELAQGTADNPAEYTASEDGTLLFCAGTWYVNLRIEANVSIIGSEGSAVTTLDGGQQASVLVIASPEGEIEVDVEGLTIEGGAAQLGGGLSIVDAIVTGRDLIIQNNHAIAPGETTWGGGIYADHATVTLSQTELTANGATSHGGGIAIDGSTVTLIDGLIHLNTATRNGAAVWAAGGSSMSLERVIVEDNEATRQGGGFYISDSEIALVDGEVRDNRANETQSNQPGGGGFVVLDGSVDLLRTSIEHNSATRSGGGLYLDDTALVVTGGLFSVNQTSLDGGAITAINGSALTLQDVDFNANTAAGSGGAILALSGTTVEVSGISVFEENQANYGGALYLGGSNTQATLEGAQLLDNEASSRGGGVYINDGDLLGSNINMANNKAKTTSSGAGGGAIACLQGSVEINNEGLSEGSDWGVTGNTANQPGGGIYAYQCDVTLNHLAFIDNHSSREGGGFFGEGMPNARFEHVRFEENLSDTLGGGAHLTNGTNLEATDVDFIGNESGDSGGGLSIIDNSSAILMGGTYDDNKAGRNGGGLYMSESEVEGFSLTFFDNACNYNDSRYQYRGGGGVHCYLGELEFTQVDLIENTALNAGGGANFNNCEVTWTQSTISGNTAGGDGGGIRAGEGGQLELGGVMFSDNVTNRDGGALALSELQRAKALNTTHEENVAVRGGGGIHVYASPLDMEGGAVTQNAAVTGGGLFLTGLSLANDVDVTTVDFSGNQPESVSHNPGGAYTFGEDATFSCDGSGCE